jgi:hypothetical protein
VFEESKMKEEVQPDLVKTAVVAGAGAGCLLISPSLGEIFSTYGKEIADIIAIILQSFGASALVVAGVRLIPYVIKYIKRWIAFRQHKKLLNVAQKQNCSKQKVQSNPQKGRGELNKKLTTVFQKQTVQSKEQVNSSMRSTVTVVSKQKGCTY